jgi:hypothetical protein
VSDFGDFDIDDAWGTEPPDEEQVTYKLHELRLALDALAGAHDLPRWDDLDDGAQQMARGIAAVIVRYIVEREPETAADLARTLHNARRYVATSPLPPWDDLAPDDRQIGVDLMRLILEWLRRQGALDAA